MSTNLAEELAAAQRRATELFAEVEWLQLIRAGETEVSISQAIFDLERARSARASTRTGAWCERA